MAQCYRALFPLILSSMNRDVQIGEIIDLSDKPDSQIRDMLRMGLIETAEGEPVNVTGAEPQGKKRQP